MIIDDYALIIINEVYTKGLVFGTIIKRECRFEDSTWQISET